MGTENYIRCGKKKQSAKLDTEKLLYILAISYTRNKKLSNEMVR